MLIGELSKQSGFPRDTIRYYEKLGLISMGVTRTNAYKNYPLEVLERLRQIRRLKECGSRYILSLESTVAGMDSTVSLVAKF